jgi:Uma2 family endonuclease
MNAPTVAKGKNKRTSVALQAISTHESMPQLPSHRFTVSQYHRMGEAGILTENDRVELLEGWIVAKMVHNPPHDVSVLLTQTELSRRVSSEWVVRVQSAITLPRSEPEPDIAICRGPARRYVRSHPRPRDIALLVEVSDTTLSFDREFKGPSYARARIPTYWIINLIDSQVEVYSQPKSGKNGRYYSQNIFRKNESVPLVIDGLEIGQIAVRDLLP